MAKFSEIYTHWSRKILKIIFLSDGYKNGQKMSLG